MLVPGVGERLAEDPGDPVELLRPGHERRRDLDDGVAPVVRAADGASLEERRREVAPQEPLAVFLGERLASRGGVSARPSGLLFPLRPSLELCHDVLDLGVVLDRVERHVLAVAGALVAAVRHARGSRRRAPAAPSSPGPGRPSKTTTGALPPSSRCTRLTVSAAALATATPVVDSPVSDTIPTAGRARVRAPRPRRRARAASPGAPRASSRATPGRPTWRRRPPIDVSERALRHLRDDVPRRRIEDLHRLAAGRVDPLAPDGVLRLSHRDAHRDPQVRTDSCRERAAPFARL